jgi:RimJ/RimL family protein N-acetyltransferase
MITIEPLEFDHIEAIRNIRNNPAISRWLISQIPISRTEQEQWFDNYMLEPDRLTVFALVEYDGPLVFIRGYAQAKTDYVLRSAEIGVVVHPDHQRQGYGTQMVEFLLDYVHLYLSFHRCWLQVLATNERALAFFEKAGFVKEGVLREALIRGPNMVDIVIMSHLWSDAWRQSAEDWVQACQQSSS